MKTGKLILTILAMTLCIVMSGCKGELPYDKDLLMADSLLSVNADTALYRLERIGSHALGSARDRAYYALLLTQARSSAISPPPVTVPSTSP